jgi:hypothetical protein
MISIGLAPSSAVSDQGKNDLHTDSTASHTLAQQLVPSLNRDCGILRMPLGTPQLLGGW